jgi:twitching motility two-component system response regulator PilH
MTIQKVLVCDDSTADRINLEGIVSNAGYTVVSASSGREALEKAKTEKPDLIFMDVLMPEVDGFAATRALQNDPATKHIPVVLVTSKGQKADRIWAQMQGAKDLVAKPYTSDQIVEQLRNAA